MKKTKCICIILLMILAIPSCFATTIDEFLKTFNLEMVEIPNANLKILTTEVTQDIFEEVMGENPSYYKGARFPVDSASWYDAIYFCNVLSEMFNLEPVYTVNGNPDVSTWKYEPLRGRAIKGDIAQDTTLSGIRLPTIKEWLVAAYGGEEYEYSGSNLPDEVAWHRQNADWKTHEVAQKKPNNFGLYDMSGNLTEWVWESTDNNPNGKRRIVCGGSWVSYAYETKLNKLYYYPTKSRDPVIGFRFICTISRNENKSA